MEIFEEALKQGITPTIVLAVYLIFVKIIDIKRENAQIKLSNDLVNSINSISDFISNLTKNIVEKDRDKCKAAIEDSMYSSGMKLIKFFSTTIVNNHIDTNKETVLANISNIINAEYYNIYATLSLYSVNGHKVCIYLKKEWADAIEKDMIDILYNSQLTKEDKIFTFTNKINIKFQSYTTYLINHINQ